MELPVCGHLGFVHFFLPNSISLKKINIAVSNKYNNFLESSFQLLNQHRHEENSLIKLSLPMSLGRERKAKTFFSYHCQSYFKMSTSPQNWGTQLLHGRGRKLSFYTDRDLHLVPGEDLGKSVEHNKFQDTNSALTVLPQDRQLTSILRQPLKAIM